MPKRLHNKAKSVDDSFGKRLARLRKDAGLTQRDLAAHLGISNRMIAHYESEGGNPSVYLLAEIAKALKISGDELLGIKKVR